jgi:diguanylate cyclase (GGDEF)-like protein/PAS domain S-box-containing protein
MAERIRAERRDTARRHTDEDFALASFAVDHAAIAIFMLDERARVVRVNGEACRALGYSEAELLALTLHDISAQFDMAQWPDHWRALRSSGSMVLEDVHRRRDGSLVDVEIHANLLRFEGREVNVAFALDLTERHRAQRTLAERERVLSTLFGNLPGMAYRCADDPEWTMAFVSDGCLQLTERAPAELVGNATVAYEEITHRDDRARVRAEIAAALERREPWTITYRLVMPDERVKWVWERGVGVRDADDTLLHLEGFVTDITEQRRVEAALVDRERILSGLVGSLPGAAYRSQLATPWQTTFMSEGCRELTGYGPEELLAGEPEWADIIHPDDLPDAVSDLERDLAAGVDGTASEYRVITKDGDTRWLLDRAVFSRDENGRPVELVGLLIDIGARRETQDALLQSERQLKGLMSNIPGMAYRCQAVAPWRDEFIGAACLETTGYTAQQLIAGDPVWEELMETVDRERLNLETRDAIAARRRGELEYRIHTASGELRWIWDRFHVVRDADDAPVALEGLMLDVTDRHLAEERLSASRRELELHERIATVFLTRSPDEMFAAVLDLVREAVASRWGFFGYVDEDGSLVAPSLTREVWDACRIQGKDLRFPRETWGDNLWARALTQGTTQVLTREGKVPKGHVPIDRAIAVPLAFHGDTIGVFIVANPEVEYGAEAVRLLESVADYTAPVLHEWLQHASAENARLAAETSLQESESLYRTLFQQAPVGVVLYDADLVILDCNDSFAQFVGASREQLVGLDLTTSPDSRPLDALRRPLSGDHGVYEGPYTTTTTGRDLWVALKTAPRRGADGEAAGAIAVVTDRTSQRQAEDEMERLRLHDAVTGLPNRLLFADRIAQALAHAQRRRLGFAVAAVAVDRFSSLVDTLGHEACDRLLAAAAERLAATMRSEDTVASLAGSEFGLLLPGVGGPVQASASIEKTMEAFARPFQVDGHELFLNLSLGVAVYPADGADPQDLIENAEVAARRASSEGGNGWQFFHASMNDERAGRLSLEGQLHRALEREQFLLHYQPIVAAGSGEIVGLEALLRWERPGNGLGQPLDFIIVAEETGLMVPIGAWVLRTACAQAQAWSRSLGRPLRIAVHLSARQLYEASLVETVATALKESGLPARQLELEITETAAMRDPRQASRILGALRNKRVRIALDDFGTGYSSLSHLVRLPIATVKIDRSFVRDLLSVPEHAAVAASVIALGHRLSLTVVAEGVETQEERAFLRDEGCDALQGFLFSKPLAPGKCTAVLGAGPIVP